jgi:putative membrane protein
MDAPELKTTNELAVDRTDMATVRTLMAADRTLMAWIRTGLSMLSFGFTIYKFLLYVRESLSNNVLQAQGPRRFGIALIGLGTISIVFGLIDYHGMYRKYGKDSGRSPWGFTFIAGAITAFLGTYVLLTILLNLNVF